MNKRKLEALVEAAGPGARRIDAEIARGAYQFTFRGETIRATTVVEYLGCQVETQGSTGAEAQLRVAIKAQARCSRGLWAPRSSGLSSNIRLWQALVRSVLLYAAETHAWQTERRVETVHKWQNRAIRHVSRERTQDLRKRLGVHTVVSTLQVRG